MLEIAPRADSKVNDTVYCLPVVDFTLYLFQVFFLAE